MPRALENWAGSHRWRPRSLAFPASEREAAALLGAAAREGRRARAVGAAHSWTDVAASDDLAVSLARMARVLRIDRDRLEVTVEGGARLRDVVVALAREGLTPENLGSITEQTVAGAIATGTHGTGIGLGNLSTQVTRLRLATPRGEVIEVSPDAHPDLLPAARLSLGALGLVTEVTLRVVPAHDLVEEARPVAFDEVCASLDGWVSAHERVKIWWLPHTERAVRFTHDRAPAGLQRTDGPGARLAERLDRSRLLYGVFTGVLRAGARWPSVVPALNRAVAAAYFRPRRRVGPSERLLPIAMPPRHLEVEYAIPRASAGEMLRKVRALIEDEGLAVGFPVEVRFVKGDDLYLSPCYERDSCMLIAGTPSGARDTYPWFAGFERAAIALGGRPHWAKAFTMTGAGLRAAFPMLDAFEAIRRRLDPAGTMENAFTRRVFGAARG